MKALTIQQPYAWLISNRLRHSRPERKDVENRSWGTEHRGELAIHCGKAWKPEEIIANLGAWVEAGAIAEDDLPSLDEMKAQLGRVVAVARLADVVEGHASPWAIDGSKHWVLEDVRPVQPGVLAKGRQGLFDLAADEAEAVLAELDEDAAGYTADDFAGELDEIRAERLGALKAHAKRAKAIDEKAKTRQVSGHAVAGLTPGDFARTAVDVEQINPDGPLLAAKWRVLATVAAHKDGEREVEARVVYDSAKAGGLFDEKEEAQAHAKAWRMAQRDRIEVAARTTAERRMALTARILECAAAKLLIDTEIKDLRAASAQCRADTETLVTEAHAPQVDVSLVDGEFQVVVAPSLTDGTIGRRWSGASEEGE